MDGNPSIKFGLGDATQQDSPYEEVFVPVSEGSKRESDLFWESYRPASELREQARKRAAFFGGTRTYTDKEIDAAIAKVTGRDGTRHPLSHRFHELLAEAGATHDRKRQDYGTDADPFANVRASQDWGIPGWVGCMVRATDKLKRLQKFAQKGELQNESVKDSFMDLAVYALIGYVLYEEEE